MNIVMSKGYKNQHFMKNNFHSEMHEKLQITNSKESENITFFFVFQLTVHTYYQYQNSDFKGNKQHIRQLLMHFLMHSESQTELDNQTLNFNENSQHMRHVSNYYSQIPLDFITILSLIRLFSKTILSGNKNNQSIDMAFSHKN